MSQHASRVVARRISGRPHRLASVIVARGAAGVIGQRASGAIRRRASRADGRRVTGLAKRCVPGVLPGVLMLVTALISITGPGFSWDEVATADIARRTPAEIWALMWHIDAVLGPYYLAMHAWTALAGASETAMRLPQVIAMALAAGITGELGRRLFTPLTGLTAGLILVIMPNSFRYAAEARPYACSVLFSVLALLLLHGTLRRPAWWRWALYALSVLLLGLTHIVGVSVLGAHALIVTRRARPLLRPWAVSAALVLMLLVPLALLGSGQQSGQVAWIKPLSPAVLRRTPADLIGSAAAAWLLIGLALPAVARLPPVRAGRHPLPGTARHPLPGTVRPAPAGLGALCVVPMAALAAYSLLVGPLWVPRYLLIVLPPLALLAAAGIVRGPFPARTPHQREPGSPTASPDHGTPGADACRRTAGPGADARRRTAAPRAAGRAVPWARVRAWAQVSVALVVLAGVAWPGQREQRADLAKKGSDYRALTRMIQDRDSAGDAILYQDGNRALRAGVDFYYRGDPGRPVDVLLRRTAGQVAALTADEFPEVADRLDRVDRVWLVVASTGPEDPLIHKPRVAPVLRAEFRRAGLFTVHGATIAFYQRSPRRRTPR
ncbi:glycosyltransferase family 39 protein [Catenuloplanes japonicus]|uniref:glycosyltransferase family 39 protein n=1 Tax=Catenuloplanes japonicus TaxID=33876 RepID=UPI00054F49E3|nr:glycosyltransferase family 39 protein [Catenuloplanes japonicus]